MSKFNFRSISAQDVNLNVKMHRPDKMKSLMKTFHVDQFKRVPIPTDKHED